MRESDWVYNVSMEHVVYLDAKADEFSKLASGTKSMIIRGATGRKLPYGRVNTGDILYFLNNNAEGLIKAKATVKSVFNSEKLAPEASDNLVKLNQDKLQLSDAQYKKWSGKRYLVLIEVKDFNTINSFAIDKSNFSNMDDWLTIGSIESVTSTSPTQ